MAGFRCMMLSVAIVLTSTQTGWGQTPGATPSAGFTSKIYSLADFGHDAQLCQWITQTIPTTIKPESWSSSNAQVGKAGTLSYYGPGKVLVIYQSPAVHAQIDEFLQGLKKALPREQASAPRAAQVVPAQYVPANVPPPPMPAPLTQSNGYPVPATSPIPKHLFHFIIRYEGEGIIDSNVVKFAKALGEKATSGNADYAVPLTPPVAFAPVTARATGSSAPTMPSADGMSNTHSNLPPTAAPTLAPSNAFPPPPPPPPFGPR